MCVRPRVCVRLGRTERELHLGSNVMILRPIKIVLAGKTRKLSIDKKLPSATPDIT